MTSFEKIFNIFMAETKHTSLAKLTKADLIYILEHYLETSAFVEFKNCRKDLSKYKKTSFIKLINGVPEQTDEDISNDVETDNDNSSDDTNVDNDDVIVDDNIDNHANILIGDDTSNDTPIDDDISEDNVDSDDEPVDDKDDDIDDGFLIEDVDPEFTINPDEEFGVDNEIDNTPVISYEIDEIGYFEEELSIEECYILALAMILHQLQSNVNREEYLKRSVSDRDFKLSDNNKLLSSLLELEVTTRKKLKKYKNSYSYNNINELREL